MLRKGTVWTNGADDEIFPHSTIAGSAPDAPADAPTEGASARGNGRGRGRGRGGGRARGKPLNG